MPRILAHGINSKCKKWRPPFPASHSHGPSVVNILIKPVDTSHILIVFLDNRWTLHLYFHPLAIYCTNFLYMSVWCHDYDAVVVPLYYQNILCALKDIVLGLSFFSEAVFCKGHFWRRFSQILPVPPLLFSLSLLRRAKLVKKLLK